MYLHPQVPKHAQISESHQTMRPSGQLLKASDTNPKFKNLFMGKSVVPLSHSTLKGGPKSPAMASMYLLDEVRCQWKIKYKGHFCC